MKVELKQHQNQKQRNQKLIQPVQGAGIGSAIGELALTGVTHVIPWLGKKAVELGRYGASEAMRNKNFQKKAIM